MRCHGLVGALQNGGHVVVVGLLQGPGDLQPVAQLGREVRHVDAVEHRGGRVGVAQREVEVHGPGGAEAAQVLGRQRACHDVGQRGLGLVGGAAVHQHLAEHVPDPAQPAGVDRGAAQAFGESHVPRGPRLFGGRGQQIE